MDRVATEGSGFPGTNITDFAVVVVVPSLAGDRVGDGFAELVGSGGGESVEVRDAAKGTNDTLSTAEIRAAMAKKSEEFKETGGEIYLQKPAAE